MASNGRSRRRNRARWLAAAGAAGTLAAVALHEAGRRSWARAVDPCGPDGLCLPEGEEQKVLTDDGAVLSVTVAGPPDGPPVVLAHCFLCTREVWGAVARRLVADGHRVVLYDHRGHGTSTHGTDAWSIARLGADVGVVLEHFDLNGVVLAGHSIGGMAAQAFVADHPAVATQRLRGLVLVATSARPSPMPATSTTVERLLGERRLRMPTGTIGHASVRGAFGLAAPPTHHLEYVRARVEGTAALARVGGAMAISHMDLRPDLERFEVPTTVVAGSLDLLLPPYHARAMARRIPGARLEVLRNAGHMLPMERPDEVAAAIHARAGG
jgi:pimeloyl-ACP methyl ester carboxylesterase